MNYIFSSAYLNFNHSFLEVNNALKKDDIVRLHLRTISNVVIIIIDKWRTGCWSMAGACRLGGAFLQV